MTDHALKQDPSCPPRDASDPRTARQGAFSRRQSADPACSDAKGGSVVVSDVGAADHLLPGQPPRTSPNRSCCALSLRRSLPRAPMLESSTSSPGWVACPSDSRKRREPLVETPAASASISTRRLSRRISATCHSAAASKPISPTSSTVAFVLGHRERESASGSGWRDHGIARRASMPRTLGLQQSHAACGRAQRALPNMVRAAKSSSPISRDRERARGARDRSAVVSNVRWPPLRPSATRCLTESVTWRRSACPSSGAADRGRLAHGRAPTLEASRRPPDQRSNRAMGDRRSRRDDRTLPFDMPARSAPQTRARMDVLFDQDSWELPGRYRPKCHAHGQHSYSSIYGRMRWTNQHRRSRRASTACAWADMSIRHSGARLPRMKPRGSSSFPISWTSKAVQRGDLARLIGNAVPVKLGYVLGLELLG